MLPPAPSNSYAYTGFAAAAAVVVRLLYTTLEHTHGNCIQLFLYLLTPPARLSSSNPIETSLRFYVLVHYYHYAEKSWPHSALSMPSLKKLVL